MSFINSKVLRSGVLLLLAAGLFGAACAEERAPIDRVQPYALPKTFFIGDDFQSADDDPEFWTQNTMIDVGYGAAQMGLFTSTYAQPVSRIKWQVTETMLIGRAAYERIEDSDYNGLATGFETQDGIVACAFPIQKHFDIVNSYNPTTGEKLNVLEENAYDRPWYEREYIRVDWSTNMATDAYDFDTLSMVGVYGGITYEPLSYYVSDPMDEEAPYFDLEGGYFDVTTKSFARPGLINLGFLGWGIDAFPACYLDADFFGGTAPTGSCNPVEVTLRHSFRQVVDNDFQPIDYDGWRFQAYGGFAWTERKGYERNYGMTDAKHHRFLSRFQIWERAHYYGNEWSGGEWTPAEDGTMSDPIECYTPDTTPNGADPNRDTDKNGTADECEAVTDLVGFGGSQCDQFTQKCTLPFRARTPKTLVWYYATPTDHLYYEPTAEATHWWDMGLRTAIRSAQYAECMYTGEGTKEDCIRDYPMYFGQQDANDDAFRLSMEMDDCRHGKTHTELEGDQDACAAMVEDLGEAQDVLPGVVEIAQMDEAIVQCHSPVELNDHPACAPEEERLPEGITAEMCSNARKDGDRELLETCLEARNVRRGDLRYHLVNVIEEPQTPSPWGIMTSAVDPLNGQTIQSCANVWAWVNDYWAQRLVDYMRFAAGELSVEDVTDGTHIDDWSTAAKAAERGGVLPAMSRKEFDKKIKSFVGRSSELVDPTATKVQLEPKVIADLKRIKQGFTGVMADSRIAPTKSPLYQSRMNAVKGSELEAELMNDMVRQMYGVQGMHLSDEVMNLTSPLRGGNLSVRRDIEMLKQNALAERGMCQLEMQDSTVSINGLGRIFQEKFGEFDPNDSVQVQQERAAKMIDYIRRHVHTSVIVHEMGHAMAHRHNFVGSSDSYNYRPQYWQLRTNNKALTGTPVATDLTDPTGETTLGPRWFDPVSENEAENLIWMWSHFSIMDYAGEATQDFLGLGAWDLAALRMFYGDTVPVYPADYAQAGATGLAGARADGIMQKLDNFGGILGMSYSLGMDVEFHYTELDAYYDLIQGCWDIGDAATTEQFFKPARYDESWEGKWHPVLDGEIVSVDRGATYSKCRQQEVDYVPWRSLRPPTADEIPTDQYGNQAYLRCTGGYNYDYGSVVTDDGRIRVPYGFATDRWADIGNAAVYRHDNGADSYEIFNNMLSSVELFHIFNDYRRGRQTFTMSGSAGRIVGRYYGKMRDGAKGLALQRNYIENIAMQIGVAGNVYWDYAAENFFTDSIIASTSVFDQFVRAAQRPEVGQHVLPSWDSGAVVGDVFRSLQDSAFDESTNNYVTIPDGAYAPSGNTFDTFSAGGKLLENQLDPTMGEYEAEYTINCGSYYDKLYSAMLFTESVDNFISDSRDDFVDARYRATSMADLFPDGYRRWLGTNLTNDEALKGSRVVTDAGGYPIVDDNGYPAYGLGHTIWWGDEPQVCFPQDGTTMCAAYGSTIDTGQAPEHTMPVDSQMGWEAQKYLIAWTYIYSPNRAEMGLMENDQQWWKDQLWMTSFPVMLDSIITDGYLVFPDPMGRYYMAKKFGTEDLFGKTVQKGVASRVIEYANTLLEDGYQTIAVDIDEDGETDWYEAERDADDMPIVKYDPAVSGMFIGSTPDPNCTETDNSGCTCEMNRACMELRSYISVLDWMSAWAGFSDHDIWDWDDMTGIYG